MRDQKLVPIHQGDMLPSGNTSKSIWVAPGTQRGALGWQKTETVSTALTGHHRRRPQIFKRNHCALMDVIRIYPATWKILKITEIRPSASVEAIGVLHAAVVAVEVNSNKVWLRQTDICFWYAWQIMK